MKNLRVREAAVQARVKMWEIAAALGIADAALSRKLRYELPEEEQAHILEIIQKIKDGAVL